MSRGTRILCSMAAVAVLLCTTGQVIAQPTEACCRPDGNCFNIDPMLCQPPAIPGGPGSFCLGDNDGNGVDDACESGPPSCSPIPGTQICQMTQCPVAGQECIPTCANYDLATGAATALDCDCRPPFACHVIFPPPPTIGPNPAPPCVPADNGTGTATMPANCVGSCDGPLMVIDGLPPGTTIEIELVALQLVGINEQLGGNLGGTRSTYNEQLQLKLEGTGALAGYTRVIGLSTNNESHQGPRAPGNPVQTFDTDMFLMQGQLIGDPDFDLLRITGGTGFGMPSPGHTTLTRQGPPGSNWAVDSFFDITYRIDFIGAPGGPLGGMSGSTTGTIRKGSGSGPIKCDGQCPPNATCRRTVIGIPGGYEVCCDCIPNTPDLCPLATSYCQNLQSSQCVTSNPAAEACWPRIVFNAAGTPDPFVEACDCFPQGACGPVSIDPIGVPPFDHFYSCPGACPNPAIPCVIHINGVSTGINGISASMLPPGATVTCDCGLPPQEEGCCLDGVCFNTFPSDCVAQGGAPQGPGVFCTGVLEACCLPDNTCQMLEPICCDDLGGTSLGAGSACLGDSNGDGADDACVPVHDECEPIPGTTRCSPTACPDVFDRCQAKCAMIGANGFPIASDCECSPIDECHVEFPIIIIGPPVEEPDNPTGTATMPPSSGGYSTPDEDFMIIDGLPPGTTIVIDGTLEGIGNVVEVPGGSLGGTQSTFTAQLDMPMMGTGALAGYNRNIVMPIGTGEMHSAPRTLGDPEQEFATDMRKLHGQIVGDPDFDLLRITAGTDYGLPSPGHTTLIQLPNGNWAVDSFFDITYRIDFVGAPGGPLGGMSGSTTGTIRIWAGIGKPKCVGGCPAGQVCERTVTVTPTGTQICCDCVPDAPEVCPLYYPQLCAQQQATQCQSTDPNDACFPQYLFVTSQNPPQVMAEACSCYDTSECGPVYVNPLGPPPSDIELSCQGACPPGAIGQCLVHINGTSTGAVTVLASTVPAGAVVHCDCVDTPPVCPLESQWCANLQTRDCLLDGSTADACWPRAVTSTAAGGPNVLACDCFDDTCGPVHIDPDATGQGFIYSCPEPCPTPGQQCQIFFDDGVGPTPTGQTSVHSSNVPAGVIVTCDCPDTPDLCPLASPLCANLQAQQCQSTDPNDACFPQYVFVTSQNPPAVMAEACSCFNTFECGPVHVNPLGPAPSDIELSCQGACPPGAPGECLVHVNGASTGALSVLASTVPAGSIVSCDCVDSAPVCPLASTWCANLQTRDCLLDDPIADACWPSAVTGSATGDPNVLACDCFTDECGPVSIDLDPTGVGYIYSCPGPCPTPGVACQIFFDDGIGPMPSGLLSIPASQVPAGVIVSCDCPGEQEEACCLPGGNCFVMPVADCLAQQGTPQGPGSMCSGITTACCLPDGSCAMLDPLCCDDEGGTPNYGAQCGGVLEACCLPDGTCTMADQACCQLQGGTSYGPGSICLGDSDGDGHDDLCDPPVLCDLGGNPDYCLPLAFPDCVQQDPNDTSCWPKSVLSGSGADPGVLACECFASNECGPVKIDPDPTGQGFIYSCPGPCTGLFQRCQIHLDSGNGPQPTGRPSIPSSILVSGVVVSCDCALQFCPDVDVNCDGNVNAGDLAVVVNAANWLKPAWPGGAECDRSNANGDANVNAGDLAAIVAPGTWLSSHGQCACVTNTPGIGGCPVP